MGYELGIANYKLRQQQIYRLQGHKSPTGIFSHSTHPSHGFAEKDSYPSHKLVSTSLQTHLISTINFSHH
jgi:hypothetical protein